MNPFVMVCAPTPQLHNLCNFLIEFPVCDGEAHRQWCYEDHELLDDDAHAAFFKEHGTQWTELARLPYFDLV
jgi:hypothetical protein